MEEKGREWEGFCYRALGCWYLYGQEHEVGEVFFSFLFQEYAKALRVIALEEKVFCMVTKISLETFA